LSSYINISKENYKEHINEEIPCKGDQSWIAVDRLFFQFIISNTGFSYTKKAKSRKIPEIGLEELE
jgi:hypothetical protein